MPHYITLAKYTQQGIENIKESPAQLCADYAPAGDWETATRYARQALALRQHNALPLVLSSLWPETEALLRGGDVELAREDCQRWGELVSHLPRYRLCTCACWRCWLNSGQFWQNWPNFTPIEPGSKRQKARR